MNTSASSEAGPSTQGEANVMDQASLLQEIAKLRQENELIKRLYEEEKSMKKPSKKSQKKAQAKCRQAITPISPNIPAVVVQIPPVTKTPTTSKLYGGPPVTKAPIAPQGSGGPPVTKMPIAPQGYGGPVTKTPIAPQGYGGSPVNKTPIAPQGYGGSPKNFGGNSTPISTCSQSLSAENSMVDLTSSQQQEVEDELYGLVKSDVVGIQYYKGMVSNNEMVTLIREPHNKYDSNAVKVENTGAEQVGHIKREHARLLSHIIDSGLARVEGVIPFGASNKYRMPVHIFLWGEPAKKATTVSYLKSCGLPVDDTSIETKRTKANSFGPSTLGGMDYGHVVSSRTIVSPQEMQNELDKMFETLEEGDKTTETEPCPAICTKMYPHQKQALNWMMCKENKDILPPFWEQRGNRYMNTLTMFQTAGRPRRIPGGILADDMGLGKTLETIALILTNFVDGKPLAHPLNGHFRLPFSSSKKASSKAIPEKSHASMKKRQVVGKVSPPLLLSSKAPLTKAVPEKSYVNAILESQVISEVSSDVMIKRVDLDYQPSCVKAVSLDITSASRPRRASKRPPRYCDDDDEEDNEDGLPAKLQRKDSKGGKNNGKGEHSEPMMTLTDTPACNVVYRIDLASMDNTRKITPAVKIPEYSSLAEEGKNVLSSEPQIVMKKECSSTSVLTDTQPEKCNPPVILLDSDDELPDLPAPTITSVKKAIKEQPGVVSLPSGCDKAGRTWTSGPRGTLIVCPVSVISNWLDQFEEHVDEHVCLQLMVYYGPDRVKKPGKLKDQDVVITTYSTITSDFKSASTSPLHKVDWLRIVLDEGHIIRNPSAQQSKAIFELKAQRRWVLTGTPIQNSMKDLWSLINFLRVQPFTEKTWWSRTISRPVSRGEKHALGRVSHLMKTLTMRRLKTQQVNGKPIVDLPPRNVYLEKITFSDEEREAYDAMQNHGQVIIGRYFRQGTLLHHYGEVLAILMRLRQMCCHPRLVEKAVKKVMETNPAAIFNENPDFTAAPGATGPRAAGIDESERGRLIDILLSVLGSGSDEECSICLDSLKQAVITACAHVYCRACITSVIEAEKPHPKCPLCRGEVDLNRLVDVPAESKRNESEAVTINSEDGEVWQSSAKIDALMKSLTELRASDPSVKSIVVSQFTSLLNLLEIPLSAQGFSFSRLDGSMSADERVEAVREFSDPSPGTPTIFLLSLKAGGVGINLTAASRVFLMDPAWNPAAEDQCFDRCHRLGQTKEVIITRFVIEDSVEERMLALQDKKRQLMQGAFDRRMSPEDRRTNLVNMIKNLVNL